MLTKIVPCGNSKKPGVSARRVFTTCRSATIPRGKKPRRIWSANMPIGFRQAVCLPVTMYVRSKSGRRWNSPIWCLPPAVLPKRPFAISIPTNGWRAPPTELTSISGVPRRKILVKACCASFMPASFRCEKVSPCYWMHGKRRLCATQSWILLECGNWRSRSDWQCREVCTCRHLAQGRSCASGILLPTCLCFRLSSRDSDWSCSKPWPAGCRRSRPLPPPVPMC